MQIDFCGLTINLQSTDLIFVFNCKILPVFVVNWKGSKGFLPIMKGQLRAIYLMIYTNMTLSLFIKTFVSTWTKKKYQSMIEIIKTKQQNLYRKMREIQYNNNINNFNNSNNIYNILFLCIIYSSSFNKNKSCSRHNISYSSCSRCSIISIMMQKMF